MKIAQLASTFLPRIGGGENVVHNNALGQQELGHDSTVVTWWGLWRAVHRRLPYRLLPLLPKSYEIFEWSFSRGRDGRWFTGAQLACYQRIYEFDVWHLHMAYPAAYVAAPTLRKLGVPFVVTCHGSDIQKDPTLQYGLRLDPRRENAVREALHLSQCVVAISESNYSDIVDLGISPNKIRSVPNGVSVETIESLEVDGDAVRRKLGLPTGKHVLLTVGRHEKRKGYEYVPQVIRHLLEMRDDFIWVVVGQDTEALMAEWADSDVAGFIKVMPEVGLGTEDLGLLPPRALIEIFKASDLFVFPSLLEAFGIVLVEAMAAGLPVVATNALGCRDIVSHELTGLVSEAGDTMGLACLVDRVLRDEVLRETLVRNGHSEARKYSWQKVALQYEELYRNVV